MADEAKAGTIPGGRDGGIVIEVLKVTDILTYYADNDRPMPGFMARAIKAQLETKCLRILGWVP